MGIEDKYPDILQNIEVIVVRTYKSNPEMADYAALRTYEALVKIYSAESKGRTAEIIKPEGLEAEMLLEVKEICDWRLGRLTDIAMGGESTWCEPIDIQTMILCLRRLIKSVQLWNKHSGRQGYLNYITQFV